MWPVAALLGMNAVIHAVIVIRYGPRDHNEPFVLATIVDAALAIAVLVWGTPALWATLGWMVFSLVGLTVTFNKPQRDKTLDKVIWGLNVVTAAVTAYFLFLT